jgi:hypothetical protein
MPLLEKMDACWLFQVFYRRKGRRCVHLSNIDYKRQGTAQRCEPIFGFIVEV